MLPDYATDEQFQEFVNRPENQNRLFERIDRSIVEKMASNPRTSQVAARFVRCMGLFAEDEHDLGHVTGADGGHKVAGEDYIPDAACISKARQVDLVRRGPNPYPPDIAVDVISADIERRSDQKAMTFGRNEVLTTSVLPGFALELQRIFANL